MFCRDVQQVLIRVIDTNNHRPQFSEQRYDVSVPEDTPADTEVLQISAMDEDEKNKLTFTLLSSTDPFSLRKFRLDPGTGVLFTAEALDHETMRQHTLTVMVRIGDDKALMFRAFVDRNRSDLGGVSSISVSSTCRTRVA